MGVLKGAISCMEALTPDSLWKGIPKGKGGEESILQKADAPEGREDGKDYLGDGSKNPQEGLWIIRIGHCPLL